MYPPPFLHEVLELLYEKGQVVFYGPPGTGKTYIAKKLIEHLALSSEEWDVVQFHPSYSYEDFVLGFRPFITTRGDLNYALQAGPLLGLAGHAKRYPSRKHFLLVDEINRGNLPRIFGELLYLMEDRGQRISLMYRPQPDTDGRQYALDQDGRFALPENLYIIGTMNTADRSIGLIDAALRRRFHFVPLFPGDWPLAGLLRRWLEDTQPPEMHQVADWVDRLNHKLEARFGRHLQVGHSYFMKASLSAGGVERIWKTDIMPFLEDQLFGRESELRHFALSALRNETIDIEESTEETEVGGPGSDEQGLSDEDDLP